MQVIKKSGKRVDFDEEKLKGGIIKAINVTKDKGLTSRDVDFADGVVVYVITTIKDGSDDQVITSKDIQSAVEEVLMSLEHEVATTYIEYRKQRDLAREGMTNVDKSISRLLKKDKQLVNENANKDSDKFPVTRDLTAGSVAKAMALKTILPKHIANAHMRGDIHVHDLDYHPYSPMTNCCLIDFKGMFENGTKMGNAEITTPKSIQTAIAQTSQIVANVASNQYGGCSFDRIDEVLAPYAEMNYNKHMDEARRWIEDENKWSEYSMEKTKKDIFDSIQSLEYELNTIYSSNGQTPFFTIGFGLGMSWFEREIQRAILMNRMNGLGGKVAIFPKLVFTLKDGVNLKPGDPNYDIKQLALKCTSECMYPDILSYEKLVELTGNFKAPMGCRSFLQGWKDENGREVNAGRMNLGVTTINLPRIAIQSKGNERRFWKLLDERLKVIKDTCEFRIQRILEAEPKNANILYKDGGFGKRLNDDESVWEVMKDRRATISMGYIGLYEVGTIFYGSDWEVNPEAKEFTLNVLKYMKEYADECSNEFNVHTSVYGTPSESLTDRFCKMDRDKFGIIEDVTDKEYYTNSFHYDTRKKITPFEKIDFESEYLPYTSGGFINYVELANARQNIKALEDVWDYAHEKVGYFAVNTPIDKCFDCGFEGEFETTEVGFKCPTCGNTNPDTCDVIKRTCGYLGNPQARPMVRGRHKEIASRVKHDN